MKVFSVLLLVVSVVLLDTVTDAQVPFGIFGPGRWNSCRYLRCRLGSRCIIRRWRAVCVPYTPVRRSCNQPVNPGPCRGAFRRYFYNRFTGRCQMFVYGGCGGNFNNFISWRRCQQRCAWGRWPVAPVTRMWPVSPVLYSTDRRTSDT